MEPITASIILGLSIYEAVVSTQLLNKLNDKNKSEEDTSKKDTKDNK